MKCNVYFSLSLLHIWLKSHLWFPDVFCDTFGKWRLESHCNLSRVTHFLLRDWDVADGVCDFRAAADPFEDERRTPMLTVGCRPHRSSTRDQPGRCRLGIGCLWWWIIAGKCAVGPFPGVLVINAGHTLPYLFSHYFHWSMFVVSHIQQNSSFIVWPWNTSAHDLQVFFIFVWISFRSPWNNTIRRSGVLRKCQQSVIVRVSCAPHLHRLNSSLANHARCVELQAWCQCQLDFFVS